MTNRIRQVVPGETLDNVAVHFAGGIVFLPSVQFIQENCGCWSIIQDGQLLLFLEQEKLELREASLGPVTCRNVFVDSPLIAETQKTLANCGQIVDSALARIDKILGGNAT